MDRHADEFYRWYDRWLAAEPHWLDGAAYIGEVEGQPQHLLSPDAWQAMANWVDAHHGPLTIILSCEALTR